VSLESRERPWPTLSGVRYDAWLSKGGGERRATLERDAPLEKDDTFSVESESYQVTSVGPGDGDFDGIVFAEWIGEVGPGQVLPP
jgi:hypothetical protein